MARVSRHGASLLTLDRFAEALRNRGSPLYWAVPSRPGSGAKISGTQMLYRCTARYQRISPQQAGREGTSGGNLPL